MSRDSPYTSDDFDGPEHSMGQLDSTGKQQQTHRGHSFVANRFAGFSWLRGEATEDADQGGSDPAPISHALVLPDRNFLDWLNAAEAYRQAFERVAIIRSPAGNDLNRFRNITAVEAPKVWLQDNALYHIRRIYPSVVLVDTIKVSNPDQLKQVLLHRMVTNDRYGEAQSADGHLDERFVLAWPSDALPARITVPFDTYTAPNRRNEGIDIYAPIGTTIRSAVSGQVALVLTEPTALGYGQYVQIGTQHQGETYLITHTHLRQILVRTGQMVEAGDPLGVSDWESSKLIVQKPGLGLADYELPHVVDPTPLIYWNTMRLRPSDNGLRLRERPNTDSDILDKVNSTDDLESQEPHGRCLAKVGREGQWLSVRIPNGKTGYVAAWFTHAIAPELIDRARLTGINLDMTHRLGRPAPQRLGNVGWLRFNYNVSFDPYKGTHGNTDIGQTYARYRPLIEQYARAGYRLILVFSHQTYGEGAGFHWEQMNDSKWRTLTQRYVDMVREIARQYAGTKLIQAYQIWNEQDAEPGLGAAVPMPVGNYAFLLGESIRAIRSVDPDVKIITGGHTGGPGKGAAYAAATIRALPPGITPDGVALHPYGRGTFTNTTYTRFGHIEDSIQGYSKALPGKPLWITEWGVLDHPQLPAQEIADYAASMVNYMRLHHPGKIAAMCWFAWAKSMHNGYGLVGENDQPVQPLHDIFMTL